MPADFYPALARAITDLNPNTADARALIFARARAALVTIPSTNLSISHLDLSAAVAALETAIERIEWENRHDQEGGFELPADGVSADEIQATDTGAVDASHEYVQQKGERLADGGVGEPTKLDYDYGHIRHLILAKDSPTPTSEHRKARSKLKAIAAAAAILIFGALGYVGISGTRGPLEPATKLAPTGQSGANFLSKLKVHGVELRMDGNAAATTVAKSLQAEYGAIQHRLWDWKVCSPQAEKAMSDDGIDRVGWLKKYCFAIITFGEASSVDRARLHLVEDPASHISIVGSFHLTLGSSSNAVDPELILKQAVAQYGEPHRVRSPGGRSGRCLVWNGEDQAYLQFCAESCCVTITFEDQELIRYATSDYDRRMGIISRPTAR